MVSFPCMCVNQEGCGQPERICSLGVINNQNQV